MEVDLAVLADAANLTENGKLNILGIFDRFTLGPGFPATSPTFSIIIRVAAHPSELGKHDLALRIANADGKEVGKLKGRFEVRREKTSPQPARVPLILQAQVKIPAPGDYTFDILINGRWERSISLEVLEGSS
jgi:hypothetical protein